MIALPIAVFLDFDVKRCTRRCWTTGRELHPGDVVYSALVQRDGSLARLDYSQQAWSEPPPGCIGWWRFRIPEPGGTRLYWAPPAVMIEYLQRLAQQPQLQDAAFVLALLLVRRRVCQIVGRQQDAAGRTVMTVAPPNSDRQTTVIECPPAEERIEAIQQMLVEHLLTDEPPDSRHWQCLTTGDN